MTDQDGKYSADSPLLRVRDLTVQFPAGGKTWVPAVQGVSFDVMPGEAVALVGESGSGKSVSSLAVMGLTETTGGRVTEGSIEFEGRDLSALRDRDWRKLRGPGMGMIFQQPIRSLNPAYTVGHQISETARRHLGMNRKQARMHAIKMLELVEIPRAADRYDDYPHSFSGGMCQRVMIAMVMACSPRLLIADEPTTALDVTVQQKIIGLLRDLQEQTGVSILFVSHDLAVVAELCKKVVVMYAGEVVEAGTVSDVYLRPEHPYTAGLLSSIPTPGDTKRRRLTTIPGGIPAAVDWPIGCRFFDRCGHALSGVCDVAHPTMARGAAGNEVRCIRASDLILSGVMAG